MIVTKLPLRALFPSPNRVRPKFRAVIVGAHLSEPQVSKQPLKQTGKDDYCSSEFTSVIKLCLDKVPFKMMAKW